MLGVEALEEGCLYPGCHDRTLFENLATWRKDARKLKLPKKTLKVYDGAVEAFIEAYQKDGWNAFKKANAKHGRL